MAENITLNEDEQDCLQEIMNISYGAATAAISEIINKYATLNIPKIRTANSSEFEKYFYKKLDDGKTHFISNQLVNGYLSSENMFVMDKDSVYNLCKEFGLEESEIDEDELKDVMLEISNIISTTTISKLAELIDSSVVFSPPSLKIVKSFDDLEYRYHSEDLHIIIIETNLVFKEQHIHGELIILSKNDSILYLKKALNKIIDEY
ncbi:chemotaxis protein CheC [Poseidonibacter sp.]|uniref:chemotaxis protein CheC n=1 Tax=Poseidonibacter sp. TaxID=2321188 RepID=UPI003C717324